MCAECLMVFPLVLSVFVVSVYGGSCREATLCCNGRDSSCVVQKMLSSAVATDLNVKPCYCDHACLKLGDCCSDFKAYCGEFPGQCYDHKTKIHFKPGTTHQRPGMCEEMSCDRNLTIEFAGCGFVNISDPNCEKIKQDFRNNFPECCRKYKCVHNGKVSYH